MSHRKHVREEMRVLARRGALLVALCCIAWPAAGQWSTQHLTLNPGWNAIFLEVQPEPRDTAGLFADVPVEAVWFWNRRTDTVQYVQDPSELLPEQPDWLKYFPEGSPQASFTNLYAIQGGRPYLIKLGGDAAVDWAVKGTPVIRRPDWVADSYNFVGCYLSEGSSISIAEYFGTQAAHKTQPLLRLNTAGHWVEVPATSTETLAQGAAYWVYCKGASSYAGLLSVGLEDSDGLIYSRSLDEAALVLHNAREEELSITLSLAASDTPPAQAGTLMPGGAPLSYYVMNLAQNQLGWAPLEGPVSFVVPGEGEKRIRLAVRRSDMDPVGEVPVDAEVLYQSLLLVEDGSGSLLRIPVSARGLESTEVVSAKYTKSGKAQFAVPTAGFWHGYVSVNAVSQPSNQNPEIGPMKPQATASEFKFPLLVHVDYEGRARLLQQVYLLWQDGTRTYEGEDDEFSVLEEPGHYVLVTRDELLDQFKGGTVRDGKQIGRRFSSAAFSFREPLEMQGAFGASLALKGARALTIAHDDPLNPFRHRYHPDHGMNEERPTVRADGSVESWYTVTREIELSFEAEDPELGNTAQWGDRLHGGIYKETLIGLHQDLLYVEGFFRLSRMTDVAVLNDGIE